MYQGKTVPIPEKLDAHIYHFYEDLDMPIGELYQMIEAALFGSLTQLDEKMDGQNVTFTVHQGNLKFLSKGASYRRLLSGGGMDLVDIQMRYADNPHILTAFTEAYRALMPVAIEYSDLFQDGKIFIETALLHPSSSNTIAYDEPSIRFIQVAAVAPGSESDVKLYEEFVSSAKVLIDNFKIDHTPEAQVKKILIEGEDRIASLTDDLDALLGSSRLSRSHTIRDLVVELVRQHISTDQRYRFIPRSLIKDTAVRLATGRGNLHKKFRKVAPPENWEQFKEVEIRRSRAVSEAIIPLEEIIQRVGTYAFRNLEFSLTASNHKEITDRVQEIRKAYDENRIEANPDQLESIRVALARLATNESLFETATEGVVFKWNGKTRKLTGMFTPINKLLGFFRYGKTPAKISVPLV